MKDSCLALEGRVSENGKLKKKIIGAFLHIHLLPRITPPCLSRRSRAHGGEENTAECVAGGLPVFVIRNKLG